MIVLCILKGADSGRVVELIGNKLVKVNNFLDRWISNGKEPGGIRGLQHREAGAPVGP